ncbi:MAG: hypothetical protein NVSMB48_04630 [Marmoricola sp.]
MTETLTTGRRERRAEAARLAIITAAGEILSEQGTQGLTLEAVAERADVVVQTIYNRVGGRAALILAVTERAVEENRVYVDPAYESDAAPIDRIRAALSAYVRFATEKPHQFRIVTSPPDDADVLALVDDLITFHMQHLAQAMGEAIAAGTITADLDPEVAATALWAMSSGILSLGMRASKTPITDERLSQLLTFLETLVLKGLSGPAAQSPTAAS